MAELRQCAARDHLADIGESAVFPHAARIPAQSQPNPPSCVLDAPCQRTIVNQFAANGRDTADALKRCQPNKMRPPAAPAVRLRGEAIHAGR